MDRSTMGNVSASAPQGYRPFRHVRRVHVSHDGRHVAIYRQQGAAIVVTVDGRDYGPYAEADVASVSPFRLSEGPWMFRARRDDGIVLIVDGTAHGPFEQIWPPTVSGERWGVLVRRQGHYHLLVDGALSAAYDEIAGDHRLAEVFDLQDSYELDVPLLFGARQWGAFGRRGTELFIITADGEHGPFQAIGRQRFDGDPPTAELRRNLSLDRSTLAVAVAKPQAAGGQAFYLWVNGVEYGPAHEMPASYEDVFLALVNMSTDGQRWAFRDRHTIYTHEGTFGHPMCQAAVLSDNGAGLAQVYGPEHDIRFTINGTEYGPFERIGLPSFSPDGTRWVAGVRPPGGTHDIILTESGPLGPFQVPDLSPFFSGAQWVGQTVGVDGKKYLLMDGHPFGPYDTCYLPGRPGLHDRTEDHEWIALGFRPDGPVDVFLTGRFAMTTPPFQREGSPASRGSHWSVVGRQGDRLVIVEDGRLSPPLGPFKRTRRVDRSEDCARLALTVKDANDHYLVLFRDAIFGPYPEVLTQVHFAPDGSHWSFELVSPGARRVISDHGESPVYDEVVDRTVTGRGTVFAGRQGTRWWLHVGDKRYGPFEAAGMVASGDEVTAVVISLGRVKVRAFRI
jgi:hypothetical protein